MCKIFDELEVTGVSRSGRVRKKSSKLIDYESGAEEIERPKRKLDISGSIHQRNVLSKKQNESKRESSTEYTDNGELENTSNDNQQLDSEPETNIYQSTETFNDSSIESSGTELDEDLLDDKDVTNTTHTEVSYNRSSPVTTTSTSQKSLYMLETFAKKRKNGRGPKAGRKDKGKARFSAYMLWAREVRPDLMKSNPNIDFSQLSSKLSDLWATVPYTDKYMWKQKAKRMAMLAKNSDNVEEANVHKAQIKMSLRRKYINKKANVLSTSKGITIGQDTKTQQPVLTEITNPVSAAAIPVTDTKPTVNEVATISKNVSTQPLDVAAHLKLLGESLSIIGQRLKEHEGQIAVSGSLSVLLDTLLCSLGPLLCLTQQVEEMNGCSKETLSSILDNIAYIMPGL
ncbi:hypothetical protein PGB90_008478 [Kerria lacca]